MFRNHVFMLPASRIALRLAVGALACMPLVGAAAEKLNVKTGLWEITSVTQFSGVLPLPKELREKMTPEQLKAIAEQTKANAADGPARDTSQECITEKDLEQPFQAADTRDCKQTIVTSTRTAQELRFVCEGEYKGGGVMKVSTPTPETMKGTVDLKLGEGPDPFTLKGTLSGRWLGADCGDEAEDDAGLDDDEPADDSEEEEEE